MLRITIACVGKLKEKYLVDAVAEFLKRLTPFAKVEIVSINEEKMPDSPTAREKELIIAKETERLVKLIPTGSYVIALDVEAQQLSSPELAQLVENLQTQGVSHLCFVIGGAFGYSDVLRQRADKRLSFSRLTFTHQMIRLLLVEQIYRAFKIMHHEKYHW